MKPSKLELEMKLNDIKRARAIAQNRISSENSEEGKKYFEEELSCFNDKIEIYEALIRQSRLAELSSYTFRMPNNELEFTISPSSQSSQPNGNEDPSLYLPYMLGLFLHWPNN
ncbi:hypothetical protein SteCoe_2007 [Stentor coeruleus]|uniref:Uncharacterized protein n=1 Tax=Stentor coeruleus TaxID=5963 RepID=A0A1R2D0Q9_9CILI|nr:hypothetical protein SteCoe_2007 [Stentor coeruleus]